MAVAVREPAGETSPALSFLELPVNNNPEAIIENIRTNCQRGLPQLKQLESTDRPLIVVGGGPSLHDYLPVLKSFRPDCDVLAVNGAYKFLRSVGIDADHFILIDSRRDNVAHVEAPHPDTNHYLASQVHPEVFDALRDHRVTMFHLATETGLAATKDLPPPQTYSMAPVGMASVHAIYLGAALGYRRMFLFGYDFSHKAGETYAFEQAMNKHDASFEVVLNGEKFRTTLALARTAEQFAKAVSPVIRSCDLDIRVFSSGLLPEVLKAAMSPATEESERAKYEDIWKVPLYRKVSPGLEDVERAIALLSPPPGARIADLGCGTGRVVRWLGEQGYDHVGVDIASNCLDDDGMPYPFIQCALWDCARLPRVEYALCTDVLEHIPTERVRDTLRAIHDSVEVACYLNIDTIEDSFGVWIGRKLHMTVMDQPSWEKLLKEFWPIVEPIPADERQAVFICRK